MEKEDKIHIYYYVLLDYDKMRYFDGGISFKNEWSESVELCDYVKNLTKARELKKKVKDVYDVDCKIIKVDLLEVE